MELGHQLPGELDITETAGCNQPTVPNRRFVKIEPGIRVVRDVALEIPGAVACVPAIPQETGLGHRDGSRADRGDRHLCALQAVKEVTELGVQGHLLPPVAARENEGSDVAEIRTCQRPGRLDTQATHGLHGVSSLGEDLYAVPTVAPKLGKRMGWFPVGEPGDG